MAKVDKIEPLQDKKTSARKKKRLNKRPSKSNAFIKSLVLVATLFSLLLSLVYSLSSFSGVVNPLEDAKWAYLGMVYPILLLLMVVFVSIWAIARKWIILAIMLIVMGVTYNEILTYSPINWPWGWADDGEKEISLLSYNVMGFNDFDDSIKVEQNRTIDFILNKDADIVCLQEVHYGIEADSLKRKITKGQLKSLNLKYPHQWQGKRDLYLLSKYPITRVRTLATDKKYGCDLYELNIEGQKLTVISVHLQSIGLSMTDKELYYNMTSLDHTQENIDSLTTNVKAVRKQLLSKLGDAFRERARQAKRIRDILETIEGNVVLCGDFNDTPGSYAYKQIASQMNDAYRDCAFGPTLTYHDNRFYFRIDHIFYRGDEIEALEIERCKNNSSDHSALFSTFAIDINK